MHGSTGGRWRRSGLTVDGPVAYRACLGGSEKPPAPSESPPPRQRSTLPPPVLRRPLLRAGLDYNLDYNSEGFGARGATAHTINLV